MLFGNKKQDQKSKAITVVTINGCPPKYVDAVAMDYVQMLVAGCVKDGMPFTFKRDTDGVTILVIGNDLYVITGHILASVN